MASGRVGGTRSKISGQVGEEVYQIRKNNDGTYTQVITAKGETTVNYTTPRLQAQRMCTSMVEAMMRDLKEVGKISMQSAANKSKSLNAFSSYNLQLVARDCKANWYGNNQFVYPELNRFDIKQRDLGGLYMLSSGTLQFNVFAGHATQDYPTGGLIDYPHSTNAPEGLYFSLPYNGCSIGDFLRANRMTRLDTVVFCMFGMYAEYNTETEENDLFYKHNYMIAQINPALSDGVVITDDILPQLFVGSSNRNVICKRYAQRPFIFLGFDLDIINKSEEPYTWGAFSISYADGKKKISSSSYQWYEEFNDAWLSGHAPADVFGTWIGEPQVKPYPYIF